MKRSSSLALVGVAALAATSVFVVSTRGNATVSPASPPKSAPAFPSRELAELDRVVQARFAVVPRDGSFGYDRIEAPIIMHGEGFSPQSKPEWAAISKLRATKQQVVFFLVGRPRTATSPMTEPRVQGPLVMTSHLDFTHISEEATKQAEAEDDDLTKNAPKEEAFVPVANMVLTQAKLTVRARRQAGGWKVVACPVPASSQACVTCHNNMAQAAAKRAKNPSGEKPDLVSLHDPLGVALYCVRTAPKAPAQQKTAPTN